MFINKEGKLFGKISIIDIFVVLVIVVAAFGVYSRFIAGNETVETNMSKIQYEMKVKKVREASVTALEKGGALYDSITKEYMGEIVSVEAVPCMEDQQMSDGTIVMSEIPERFDVYITLNVDGSSNKAGYYTKDNKNLCVGSSLIISTKFAETTGEIISISEID